jgi:hypothetical protein
VAAERPDQAQQVGVAGHRELARHLFGGLAAEAFDGFDAGLSHVADRLRALVDRRALGS